MTVKEKHDGFAEMRAEFALAREDVNQYTEQFWGDVRDKQQLAVTFREEMSDMESTFEQALAAFDAYAAEFESDVATKQDAATAFREEIEATRDAFETMLVEFEAYTEDFEDDVGAKQQRVDEFREEVAATHAAFAEALGDFEEFARAFDQDVQEKQQDVEAFLETVEEVRAAYEQASDEFSRAVVEFYGYEEEPAHTATATTAGSVTDDESVSESSTTDGHDPADADADETERADDGVDIPVGDSELPTINDQLTGEDAESQDSGGAPEDMVKCLTCGEYYQAITESHLQTHELSMEEYKEEHGPDVALFPGEE